MMLSWCALRETEGLKLSAASHATLAFDLPTCCRWKRNCRFRLLTSIVSRSIWNAGCSNKWAIEPAEINNILANHRPNLNPLHGYNDRFRTSTYLEKLVVHFSPFCGSFGGPQAKVMAKCCRRRIQNRQTKPALLTNISWPQKWQLPPSVGTLAISWSLLGAKRKVNRLFTELELKSKS